MKFQNIKFQYSFQLLVIHIEMVPLKNYQKNNAQQTAWLTEKNKISEH